MLAALQSDALLVYLANRCVVYLLKASDKKRQVHTKEYFKLLVLLD
jgi:hypothetical protein